MPTPHVPHAADATCQLCQLEVAEPATSSSRLTDFVSKLFDTSDYPARWNCGHWTPEVGWLHIGSDIGIFIAYAAIPATLLFFIMRRRDVPLRGIFWLFAAFILSCGITHLIDATMFYRPAYRFLGLMKLVTAGVSLTTVFALARVLPDALKLPGLAAANALAQHELARRQETEQQLLKLRDQMEHRNSQLTAETRRLRTAMNAALVGAVRWTAATGAIEWQLGLSEALLPDMHGVVDNWAQVLAPSDVEALKRASVESVRTRTPLVIELRLALADVAGRHIRLSASPEGDTMTGMARMLEHPVTAGNFSPTLG